MQHVLLRHRARPSSLVHDIRVGNRPHPHRGGHDFPHLHERREHDPERSLSWDRVEVAEGQLEGPVIAVDQVGWSHYQPQQGGGDHGNRKVNAVHDEDAALTDHDRAQLQLERPRKHRVDQARELEADLLLGRDVEDAADSSEPYRAVLLPLDVSVHPRQDRHVHVLEHRKRRRQVQLEPAALSWDLAREAAAQDQLRRRSCVTGEQLSSKKSRLTGSD
eukprot:768672-Hanusia_phi.AAC.1